MSGFVSSFPAANELYSAREGQWIQNRHNSLLADQSQQAIGAGDTEMAARIAQSLVTLGDDAKAAQLFPGMIADAQSRGFLRHLNSPVWPGMERAKVVAAMGTSSEKQAERAQNQAGWDQITGDGATAPSTTTSSVTAPPAQPRPTQLTTIEPETGLPVLTRSAPAAAAPGAQTALADIHPNLTSIQSPSGAKLTVAADAAPRFQGLIDDLHAAGYTLDPATTGGYNARNIAGTNTPSQHAYGSAIDINWQRNARGANTPSDIPPELARALAAKHGLTWGGDWTGDTRDPMHFEVARGGPQTPARGVAARTGGTDVAGPGAGSGGPPAAPAAGGGGGMLAGLTPDQQRVVAGMRASGVPFATAMTQIQHFKEQNAAAAHQAFEDQRQRVQDERAARTEAGTAAQREIENTRAAEAQRLAQASDARQAHAATLQDQQAAIPTLTRIAPLIENDTATKEDRLLYSALMTDTFLKPRTEWVDDPKNPGVKIPNTIPGALPPGFPAPDYRPGQKTADTTTAPTKTTAPPQTEGQAKAAGFLLRMQEEERQLATLIAPKAAGGKGYNESNIIDQVADHIPFVGNYLKTDAGQQYMSRAMEWARAKLRFESGATIGDAEALKEARIYFPIPGDSKEEIGNKRRRREVAIEALRLASGGAAKGTDAASERLATERASPPAAAVPPPWPGYEVVP